MDFFQPMRPILLLLLVFFIFHLQITINGENFFFYGFFPEKRKKLDEDLKSLSNLNSSIIFFVSAKKIKKIFPFLKKYFIDRKSELENLKVRMKEKPGDFSCECQSIFKD